MSTSETSDSESNNKEEPELSELSREELCKRLTSAGIAFETKDSTERLKLKLKKHINTTKEARKNQEKKDTNREVTDSKSCDDINPSKMTTCESKIKMEFELGKDDWETFIERMELYFTANNVTANKKQAAILLTKVSPDTYKLEETFVTRLSLRIKLMTK